jgi:hypothetical protein
VGPKVLIVVEVVGGRALFWRLNYFVNRVSATAHARLRFSPMKGLARYFGDRGLSQVLQISQGAHLRVSGCIATN